MAPLTSGRLGTRARSERGAEIIELALVTPILALLIAAMFDFGFLFRNWEVATNAAREGARVGVLPSYGCNNATTDVSSRVTQYMNASGISGGFTTDASTTAIGAFTSCVVTVQLEQPLPSLSVIATLTGGSFSSIQIKGKAVMRTEAQAAPAP